MTHAPVNQIPVEIRPNRGVVQWMDRKNTEFSDPFFRQTIERHRKAHGGHAISTAIPELTELATLNPDLPLCGLVYHRGRCGSTLLAPDRIRQSVYLIYQPYSGLNSKERLQYGLAELIARTLARYCEPALAAADNGMLLIDYEQIEPTSLRSVLNLFSIATAEADFEKMCALSSTYSRARDGKKVFISDSQQKREMAPAVVKELAERWVLPGYERLRWLSMSGTTND